MSVFFLRYHKQHLYTEMEMCLQWMFKSWAQELQRRPIFMACIQRSNMNYPTIRFIQICIPIWVCSRLEHTTYNNFLRSDHWGTLWSTGFGTAFRPRWDRWMLLSQSLHLVFHPGSIRAVLCLRGPVSGGQWHLFAPRWGSWLLKDLAYHMLI